MHTHVHLYKRNIDECARSNMLHSYIFATYRPTFFEIKMPTFNGCAYTTCFLTNVNLAGGKKVTSPIQLAGIICREQSEGENRQREICNNSVFSFSRDGIGNSSCVTSSQQ